MPQTSDNQTITVHPLQRGYNNDSQDPTYTTINYQQNNTWK